MICRSSTMHKKFWSDLFLKIVCLLQRQKSLSQNTYFIIILTMSTMSFSNNSQNENACLYTAGSLNSNHGNNQNPVTLSQFTLPALC